VIKHYRGDEFIQNIEPVSAILKRALMGPFIVELELADVSNIYIGDRIQIKDTETYTFEVRTIQDRKVTAEHLSYLLRNYAVIDKYLNDPPTYDDQIEFADVSLSALMTFLEPLLQDAGFSVVNNSNSTETKDISFAGDNLLSAIQKICDIYKVEFVPHDTYIEFVDQAGHNTGWTVYGGINTPIIKKKVDRTWICTRIYPVGSGENLPDGYYYSKLRPTNFDVETKTHSGNLYLEANTDKYGIIEKVVEFPDIKINSRRGTVQGTGESTIYAGSNRLYPYIYDENLADIDEEKAQSATLFIVDGLKAAELRIVKVSASEKKIWYSKTLKDGSELSWTPSTGANYTLVGYISQAEVDAAKDKLIAEAQKYLDEHSEPKVEYNVDTTYWKNPPALNPGDELHLIDETQNIDTTVRIIEFEKDLILNVYRKLKLSNALEKIPYEILREQMEQKRRLKELRIKLEDNARTAREALERHNLLVRNNFYGSENEYVLIGSEHRNYVLRGVTINPDDGTPGLVSWTSGEFQVVQDTAAYTIGAGSQQLNTGTYWLYIQIKQGDYANANGYNKLVFSLDKKENTSDLLYYPLGMAEFDGTRTKVGTSYGFTLIDGNYIKTGTLEADKITTGVLKGSNGTTKFDLDNDYIDIANGAIKAGKSVIDGNDGIFIKAGNMYVEGEIDTSYLMLTKSAIVDLAEYKQIASREDFNKPTSTTFELLGNMQLGVLLSQTLITAKGAKTYFDNIPIKLRVDRGWCTEGDDSGQYYYLYYELWDGTTKIYTSSTFGPYSGYWDNTWHWQTLEVINLYSYFSPAANKFLTLKLYGKLEYSGPPLYTKIGIRVYTPKTSYIVHCL